MRTKLTGIIAAIGVLSVLLLSGCGSGNTSDALTNEKLFKSYSTGTYYKYNANGTQALKVSGKPFMAIRYLKVAPKEATDCFFGLYDVTQQELIAGTTHDPEITAGDVTFYPQFSFPNGTRIVRVYDFGSKNRFEHSDPIITVREANTEWRFTLNDQSVKATTRVTGQASKLNNAGIDTEGGIFKAMDATPSQP